MGNRLTGGGVGLRKAVGEGEKRARRGLARGSWRGRGVKQQRF
jgi:hypothetical protein